MCIHKLSHLNPTIPVCIYYMTFHGYAVFKRYTNIMYIHTWCTSTPQIHPQTPLYISYWRHYFVKYFKVAALHCIAKGVTLGALYAWGGWRIPAKLVKVRIDYCSDQQLSYLTFPTSLGQSRLGWTNFTALSMMMMTTDRCQSLCYFLIPCNCNGKL